ATMVEALAQLHVVGATANWTRFYRGADCFRVAGLPHYPFERQQLPLQTLPANCDHNPTANIEQWGYVPHWQRIDPAQRSDALDWLIFSDRRGVGSALRGVAAEHGGSCAASVEALSDSMGPVQVVYLETLDWSEAAALDQETLPDALVTQFLRLVAVL